MSEISRKEYLRAFFEIYSYYYIYDEQLDAIDRIINGHSLAGRMLMHINDQEPILPYIRGTYSLYRKNITNTDQNIYQFVNQLYFEGYTNVIVELTVPKYISMFRKRKSIHKYMGQSIQKCKYYHNEQKLVSEWKFDVKAIANFYNKIKNKGIRSYRDKEIINIYDKYIEKDQQTQLKHICYQFIQYLMTISSQQFDKEFYICNDGDVERVTIFVDYNDVKNLDDLIVITNITKHFEWCWIDIDFSDTFIIEKIPNEVIISMFDNIENKLQRIDGSYGTYFIIIHRISDQRIVLKSMLNDYNISVIDQILQVCADEQLYDIVIRSEYEYKTIGSVRTRYLNYRNPVQNIEITLSYPESLISATLYQVTIANLAECVNLRNLYSKSNFYSKEDIEQLHNLKRLRSLYDKYEDDEQCLLAKLFENNKMEYIHVYNADPDSNIINSTNFSQNITNLRYMNVYQNNGTYNISLDVSSEFPENIVVYDIQTNIYGDESSQEQLSDEEINYGTITGPEMTVAKVQLSLVHDIEVNY